MTPVKRRKKLPSAPAQGFHFDEANHLYFLDGQPLTGCTTILGVLAKPALIPWAAKMAVEYVEQNWDPAILWPDAVERFGKMLAEARNAHARKRDTAADSGTLLHELVEEWVRDWIFLGSEPVLTPTGEVKFGPIKPFIEWARKEDIRFIATEQRLYSKSLWVAGTADLIFEKDGRRYVGDVKTFKKIWDKVPLIQCAGYALMYEEMQHDEELERIASGQKEVGEYKRQSIDGHCIICLPKERAFDESQDVLWSHDTEGDREAFLSAVRLFRYLNNK